MSNQNPSKLQENFKETVDNIIALAICTSNKFKIRLAFHIENIYESQ